MPRELPPRESRFRAADAAADLFSLLAAAPHLMMRCLMPEHFMPIFAMPCPRHARPLDVLMPPAFRYADAACFRCR